MVYDCLCIGENQVFQLNKRMEKRGRLLDLGRKTSDDDGKMAAVIAKCNEIELFFFIRIRLKLEEVTVTEEQNHNENIYKQEHDL